MDKHGHFTHHTGDAPRPEQLADPGYTHCDAWIGVRGYGLPYPVQIRLGRAADGRLICTGLKAAVPLDHETAADFEVTARSLREIPLTRILTAFAAKMDEPSTRAFQARLFPSWHLESLAVPFARPPVRPGPKGHPRSFFEGLAKAYERALLETPRCPTKTLAATMGYSEPQVHRLVQRARDMGLLGESMPGKPGSKPAHSPYDSNGKPWPLKPAHSPYDSKGKPWPLKPAHTAYDSKGKPGSKPKGGAR